MAFDLDYFYGGEMESFRFYRIPKALFAEELSLEAVTLYGLMLDRVGLSVRNGWTDKQGRVYIYFVQTDVQKHLRCGHNRATAFMRELERFGLIERRRQGLGKPAIIYVKNFAACEDAGNNQQEDAQKDAAGRNQKTAVSPAQKEAVKAAPDSPSRMPEAGVQECPEQAANDTEKKETEGNETNRILPQPPRVYGKRSQSQKTPVERMDEMDWVQEKIRENIEYNVLTADKLEDRGIIDGYVGLMTEACCTSRETVRVCGNDVPVLAVRRRFLGLGREHILYVLDCLKNTTAKIGNIKAYTLAALYNAPVTMEQYYDALVSRDFSGCGTA